MFDTKNASKELLKIVNRLDENITYNMGKLAKVGMTCSEIKQAADGLKDAGTKVEITNGNVHTLLHLCNRIDANIETLSQTVKASPLFEPLSQVKGVILDDTGDAKGEASAASTESPDPEIAETSGAAPKRRKKK